MIRRKTTATSPRPAEPPDSGGVSTFPLRRRREEAREQLRAHRRSLANGVIWPVWGSLALLSVFVMLSPLIGVRWRPEYGQVALIIAAISIFVARRTWQTLLAAGRVSRLDAEILLRERAEKRQAIARARSEGARSEAKLPIPSESSTVDLPVPAAAAAPSKDDLPRV